MLPRRVLGQLEEWELREDGPPRHGSSALIVPVRQADGSPAILKLDKGSGAQDAALGLTRWGGRGAVRLLRAHPRRGALLLERLEDMSLADSWDVEACETVGALYGLLHVPAPPQLRRLSSYVADVADRLAQLPRSAPIPHRLVAQAMSLGRRFAADSATDGTLLHTDLHYRNVLEGADGSWLAIDPKPLSGDPHYEPAPLLWNRYDELQGDVRNGVRRRFHAAVDAAGLDEDRARDWVIVRMMATAVGALEDRLAGRGDRDAETITRCIAIAKAVQD